MILVKGVVLEAANKPMKPGHMTNHYPNQESSNEELTDDEKISVNYRLRS